MPGISVDDQLTKVPAGVRPILESARRIVKTVAPRAVEVAYQSKQPTNPSTMWKLARYRIGDEYVLGIGTFSKHSTLFFYRGRELDDGSGLLQGGGKDTRFVTLRAAVDAERPAVKRLVRQAFELTRS